jgi:hypothetical protein
MVRTTCVWWRGSALVRGPAIVTRPMRTRRRGSWGTSHAAAPTDRRTADGTGGRTAGHAAAQVRRRRLSRGRRLSRVPARPADRGRGGGVEQAVHVAGGGRREPLRAFGGGAHPPEHRLKVIEAVDEPLVASGATSTLAGSTNKCAGQLCQRRRTACLCVGIPRQSALWGCMRHNCCRYTAYTTHNIHKLGTRCIAMFFLAKRASADNAHG